ncbi:DUF3820 family protein [Polaribacter gangjinensis]|uniref:Cytoplasmic protein n=1 Tax=Polaribacter gangjinensis TaxID=574710 RepID=A0A2S7WCM2_9FLAO|nr:DUF3820 family protein [Polaribacter gangjinensis]PQJ75002.1 hypothetical protein BTO13_06955 [Polaribacter gangjinensis]
MEQNKQFLIDLATAKMPFGKYKNQYLIDLPEFYIVWFKNQGFPKGKLGNQLALIYELKLNGLEDLVKGIRNKN